MVHQFEAAMKKAGKAPDLYAPAPPTLNLEHLDFSHLEEAKPKKPRA